MWDPILWAIAEANWTSIPVNDKGEKVCCRLWGSFLLSCLPPFWSGCQECQLWEESLSCWCPWTSDYSVPAPQPLLGFQQHQIKESLFVEAGKKKKAWSHNPPSYKWITSSLSIRVCWQAPWLCSQFGDSGHCWHLNQWDLLTTTAKHHPKINT